MKNLLPKIKNIFSFKKINPHQYWKNLLYVFFTMIIILIIFSLYLLFNIKNQQIFKISSISTTPPSLINEKLLNKVTESFNNKTLREKEIKENGKIYKDPSL